MDRISALWVSEFSCPVQPLYLWYLFTRMVYLRVSTDNRGICRDCDVSLKGTWMGANFFDIEGKERLTENREKGKCIQGIYKETHPKPCIEAAVSNIRDCQLESLEDLSKPTAQFPVKGEPLEWSPGWYFLDDSAVLPGPKATEWSCNKGLFSADPTFPQLYAEDLPAWEGLLPGPPSHFWGLPNWAPPRQPSMGERKGWLSDAGFA